MRSDTLESGGGSMNSPPVFFGALRGAGDISIIYHFLLNSSPLCCAKKNHPCLQAPPSITVPRTGRKRCAVGGGGAHLAQRSHVASRLAHQARFGARGDRRVAHSYRLILNLYYYHVHYYSAPYKPGIKPDFGSSMDAPRDPQARIRPAPAFEWHRANIAAASRVFHTGALGTVATLI